MGERLHKVLGQVGSELWFPWQQIAPIGLQWEKCCEHSIAFISDHIFILAGNKDNHKMSSKFSKIRPWTAELPALERLENGC